jgi:hypothetical protein
MGKAHKTEPNPVYFGRDKTHYFTFCQIKDEGKLWRCETEVAYFCLKMLVEMFVESKINQYIGQMAMGSDIRCKFKLKKSILKQ